MHSGGHTKDLINLNRICRKTHGILLTLRHLQQEQQTENSQMDVGPYLASPLMEMLNQLVHERRRLELLIDFYQRVGDTARC